MALTVRASKLVESRQIQSAFSRWLTLRVPDSGEVGDDKVKNLEEKDRANGYRAVV